MAPANAATATWGRKDLPLPAAPYSPRSFVTSDEIFPSPALGLALRRSGNRFISVPLPWRNKASALHRWHPATRLLVWFVDTTTLT